MTTKLYNKDGFTRSYCILKDIN